MLRTADNVFSVILDDNSATTAALNATCPVGTVATPANVPAGAILMVDMGMRRLSNATYGTTDRYRIVQGKGAGEQFMMSPEITKASATISTSNHRASVQQVSVVGYNGTANALPAANSTDYFIKIRKNDNDAANRSQPMSLFAGPIKSSASTSQIAIAEALVKNGTANFADEPANNYLKFEMLNAGARSASTAGAGTLTFTNGSRLVKASAATASTNFVAGDFVTIGAATTAAVYKVTAIAANGDLTLSTAFEGATTAAITSSTGIKLITAAVTAAAASGVRMTGIQADFNVNSFRDYYVNRFSVAFSDVSTVVTTAGARTGSGMWEQVAMDEYMSYGFEGMNGMLGVPPAMRDQAVKIPGKNSQTDLTARYGCLEISWTESIQGLVSLQGGKGSVLIYVNLNNTSPLGVQGNTATSFDLTRTVLLQPATAFNMV